MIISGGQTGVDRAALDAAIELGIPCGGWCPAGRRSEAGPIPQRYPLLETSSSVYPQRTRMNVRDSDATLIICQGPPSGGTLLTLEFANRKNRPCLAIDLSSGSNDENKDSVKRWLKKIKPCVLNIAGPRENEASGIYLIAFAFLRDVLRKIDSEAPCRSRAAWPPVPPATPTFRFTDPIQKEETPDED